MKIWDAHVHCYPDWVARDPASFARKQGEPHWEQLVTGGPQGWADPELLLKRMDEAGIHGAVILGWYWENPETAKLQNEWTAQWIARYPDRLKAFAAIHPKSPTLEDDIKSAVDAGFCGVGECLPHVQGSHFLEDGWQSLCALCTQYHLPINLHITEPAGHRYPGRVLTPLDDLLELISRFPDITWILAHWGGGLPFYCLNRRVDQILAKTYFDSAASPLLYRSRIWQHAVQLVGADRVLFGSDFPLRLFPRKEKEPRFEGIRDQMLKAGLSSDELEMIAGKNLLNILFQSRNSHS